MMCPECKSTKIINTQKEDYCSKCGLVLTTYYEYTAGIRVEYPLGFKR
jgi:transcription initiation factor TFIIIB Brf1 subunit/transcription initiation factor TFIIB